MFEPPCLFFAVDTKKMPMQRAPSQGTSIMCCRNFNADVHLLPAEEWEITPQTATRHAMDSAERIVNLRSCVRPKGSLSQGTNRSLRRFGIFVEAKPAARPEISEMGSPLIQHLSKQCVQAGARHDDKKRLPRSVHSPSLSDLATCWA